MLKKHSLLSAVALFAALGAAHAQDDEPVEKRFYVVGGGNFTEGDKERGAEFTTGFNVGIGKRITKHFGVELKAAFKNFDNDATDRVDGDPNVAFNADTKSLSLDLFYHLGGYSKWDPYIVAGIGRSDYEAELVDNNGMPTDQGDIDFITGEVGVGVRNEFTERGTAIRLDLRYRRETVTSGSGDFNDVDNTDFPDFDDLVINFDFVMPLGERQVDEVRRPFPESDFDGRFYLVPSVQFMRPDGNRASDDNYGYALAFGKQYTDNASVELRVSSNDLDPQGSPGLYSSWNVLSAGVDVLMHREIYPKLRPYLVLGVGYETNKIDGVQPGPLDISQTPADGSSDLGGLTVDYGFGVQSIGYRSRVGWRFDLRGRHVSIDRDQNEGLNNRTSADDLLVNVGAVIPLGKNPYKARDEREAAERAAKEAADAAAAAARKKAQAEAAAAAAALAAAAAKKDTDGDTVVDEDDECPNTPAGAEVDTKGCELDNDMDGVKNSKDECPNTVEGAEVDAKGCELDDDKDGVKNSADKCPNTDPSFEVDATGCALVAQVLVLEGVNFETNSAKLTLNAQTILNKTASSLSQQSGLRVEIGGHTDWVGPAAYNQRLSQKRAESVKTYLVSKGVDADNIETKGYGESSPTADNKTADGRERNRRVELKTLGDGPAAE